MKPARLLLTFITTLVFSAIAIAQPGMATQGDQIDQLDQIVDLNDQQKQDLRALIAEMEPEIEANTREAQQLQRKMGEYVSADFDEDAIRADAARLGELTTAITVDSVLLQSKMQALMTEEQLATLDAAIRQQQQQMQQMREQMQRQQGGGAPMR